MKDKTIGILMGGLSPEREVSLSTGNAVLEAVQRKGLKGVGIDVDHDVAEALKKNGIDLAFIALHGVYGEDGTIQGLLEYARIPYTGPGVLGSALAYDKVKSKEIFKLHGIPTADYQVFHRSRRENLQRSLDLPVVVKPSNQGSSVGVSIVREEKEWDKAMDLAFDYSEEVVVEKFIEGKLLAVGMNGEQPMPIVHIQPKSGFYDYEAKYTRGKTDYVCPAKLDTKETQLCQDTAVDVFRALRGCGMPRVDMILDAEGTPYVLEMNTIPGLTPTSLLPMAAQQSGMDFDALVIGILKSARLDYGE
ncbi:MAG: D-alanine--D-alanine ligase [Nitrospinae bacterium]|nr:D-alanine--D-alanine ligase [Nitrospinota bacterium]